MVRGASSISARYGLPAEIADLSPDTGPDESAVFRTPSPSPAASGDEMISLRDVKRAIRGLRADHPLRIVLLGEPDEMPRAEFASKLLGWVRLAYCAKD
jgi:hypothetical protein